jgi:hypothetical protein
MIFDAYLPTVQTVRSQNFKKDELRAATQTMDASNTSRGIHHSLSSCRPSNQVLWVTTFDVLPLGLSQSIRDTRLTASSAFQTN